MNLICDILIVGIVLAAAWIGKKRGLVKTFFNFFGSLIAFFTAFLLERPLAVFLDERIFRSALVKQFLSAVESAAQKTVSELDFAALPESVSEVLARFGTDSESVRSLVLSAGEGSLAEKVATGIVSPISAVLSGVVAFVLLFVLASVLIRVLERAFNLVARLPVLNFSNRFLGLFCGVVWGLFLAFLFACAMQRLAPALQGSENQFLQSFDPEKTVLLRWFSAVNLLGFLTNN